MIRIILIDDHLVVRDAVAAALRQQGDFDIVGMASTLAEALQLELLSPPHLIITESTLADAELAVISQQLAERFPGTRLLALSADEEAAVVRLAMQSRFSGYVLKKSPLQPFIDAIRAVAAGQMYLSPQVVGAVVNSPVAPSNEEVTGGGVISDREQQVLQLVADGMSTKEIASQLSISLKTVETHRRRVMSKLKIHSVAQLTKYAIRHGLTTA